MTRLEITRWPIVRSLLIHRWPQVLITSIGLAVFLLAIVAGLLGTPVGNRNFSIVIVWILWWGLLILLAVPAFGRAWCSVCPIPAPGEWLQRGAILGPRGKGLGLNLRWPRRLRGIWLQNAAFVLLCAFSLVILTNPALTGWVLAGFLLLALLTSLTFERRAFCRYLCPVGGFIGLYSQLAPIELRVKDPVVCALHSVKSCFLGSAAGYGCPWLVYPLTLKKNNSCGLCMECLRTCTEDNIVLQLRRPGTDLGESSSRRMDEAFKSLIMLGSALLYSGVMLGTLGPVKLIGSRVGTTAWFGYAGGVLGLLLIGLPGVFLLAVAAGKWWSSATSLRRTFIAQAYALVPLGLSAWVAFSLAFVFASASYVFPVLSDPLGLGWNLLGTGALPWQPYAMEIVPYLQTGVLLVGLVWACRTSRQIAGEELAPGAALRLATPVSAFSLALTLGLIGLLVA
jgi:polyferredoxin